MAYRDDFREAQGNAFWSLPRVFLGFFVVLVLMYGMGFLATGGDLAIYRFWAPKQENAKREVFENTQGYVEGKSEYLTKLRYQYQTAEAGSSEKAALRSLILQESADIDNSKLPSDLQNFLNSLKEGL